MYCGLISIRNECLGETETVRNAHRGRELEKKEKANVSKRDGVLTNLGAILSIILLPISPKSPSSKSN